MQTLITMVKKLLNLFKRKPRPGILFEVSGQERESRAVWRILSNPLHFAALCNDTWRWFAVDVPLNLLGGNTAGEIDILVCRPKVIKTVMVDEADKKIGDIYNFDDLIFRSFEVKSALLSKKGEYRSVRKPASNKFRRTIGQLKQLLNFGCGLVWLLEIYIIESTNDSPRFSTEVVEYAREKSDKLKAIGAGYIIFQIQYRTDVAELQGGILHPPRSVLYPTPKEIGGSFTALTKYLDDFYRTEIAKNKLGGLPPVISYCKQCRELSLVPGTGGVSCKKCNKSRGVYV